MALKLGAVLIWCVLLLLGALPVILTPGPLRGTREAVMELFEAAGVRSGSFVFGGNRGDGKRRFWAMQVLARLPDGRLTRLHESPADLSYPPIRWMVSVQDTLSFKMLYLSRLTRLVEATDPEVRARALDEFRRGSWSIGVGRFFCESDRYAFADPRARVYVQAWWATVSYATGQLTPHRETLFAYDCTTRKLAQDWPTPTATPAFPGLDWGEP